MNRSVNDSVCWGVPCSLGEGKGREGKGKGREKYSCGDSSPNRHLSDAGASESIGLGGRP